MSGLCVKTMCVDKYTMYIYVLPTFFKMYLDNFSFENIISDAHIIGLVIGIGHYHPLLLIM